ncbi:hypothetical protein NPIL_615751 [Nephila pilipes]|uniref:Uncharacterized protein n=1 Tax=Nephila pilipes TaxID=299642 RepID=A0A8X6UMJ5_NEPPI|nr:hypothetical protein NPIL_615751 [Nephila pilipes]
MQSFVSLDNLSSVCTTFSGASFVSGIALTAASMPGVGILVGLGLMVGHGVYNDVSNIIEYKKTNKWFSISPYRLASSSFFMNGVNAPFLPVNGLPSRIDDRIFVSNSL